MRERSPHVPDIFARLDQGSGAKELQTETWRQRELNRRIEEFNQDGLVVISEPHHSSLRIPKVILPAAAALTLLAACARPDRPAEFRPAGGAPAQTREAPRPVQPTPEQKVEAGWEVHRSTSFPYEMTYPTNLFDRSPGGSSPLQSKEKIQVNSGFDVSAATVSVTAAPILNTWVRFEDRVDEMRSNLPYINRFATRGFQILADESTTVGGERAWRFIYTEVNPFQWTYGWAYNHIITHRTIVMRSGRLWTIEQTVNFWNLDKNFAERFEPVFRKMLPTMKFLQ